MRLTAVAALATIALGLSVADALAQGWGWWPWSQPEPRRREPLDRPPLGAPLPPGQPPPGQQPPPQGQGQVPAYGGQRMSNICLQLEQRLVAETQGTGQGREILPKIESDMRAMERQHQTAQLQLNRADCWDQFLFSRTLRRTPRCVQLANEVESARQRLADLEAQRRQIMGTGERRSYQDDIIRELARVSRPGRRVYVQTEKLPYVRNGFGIGIISTSKGVMSCKEARKLKIGGEYLCRVY